MKTLGSPKELVKHSFPDADTLSRKQNWFFKIKELFDKHIDGESIVLDAGCGWGRFILRLRRLCRKSFEMVGVDVDDFP
ncbi:MAG: hypothetical protein ACP5JW_06790 [Candidatus Bathyarchaeia archaeon]